MHFNKNNTIKAFLFFLGCISFKASCSSMVLQADHEVTPRSSKRLTKRLTRDELRDVVDGCKELDRKTHAQSLVIVYNILRHKIERRLPSVVGESLENATKQKLISDILSITKIVAWSEEFKPEMQNYEDCINFLTEIEKNIEGERNLAILNANLAKITYKKFMHEKGELSFAEFDANQEKRKIIYDRYMKAIKHRAAKIVYLKAADLILECEYSPKGNSVEGTQIASELLSDFFTKRVESEKEGGLILHSSLVVEPSLLVEARNTESNLPFAGNENIKNEALRLQNLLNTRTSRKSEGTVSGIGPSSGGASSALNSGAGSYGMQVVDDEEPNPSKSILSLSKRKSIVISDSDDENSVRADTTLPSVDSGDMSGERNTKRRKRTHRADYISEEVRELGRMYR